MLLNIDNLEDKPSTENSREGNNKEVINYHSLMDLDKSDSLGNKKYVDILEDKVKISSSKTIGLMDLCTCLILTREQHLILLQNQFIAIVKML